MGFRNDVFVGDASLAYAVERVTTLPDPDEVIYTEARAYKNQGLACSSSLALETWPSVVWDVNGYYHELGVGFRATRKELMRAYQAKGGPDDQRLTYIFAQLLDPEMRRRYDAAALGCRFVDDYVLDELRQQAAMRLGQMRSEGITASEEEILREMGLDIPKEVDNPQEMGDIDGAERTSEQEWGYGYYLRRVRRSEAFRNHSSVMQAWQDALLLECYRQGVECSFAVGVTTDPDYGFVRMSVQGTMVVFLSLPHHARILELARIAVEQIRNSTH